MLKKVNQKQVDFITYAIESVADPFPALASTTSVPPSCVLLVRAIISSSERFALGVAYTKRVWLGVNHIIINNKYKNQCLHL